MLYSYLSQIKFVVEAKMEGGSFEDKYIAKFWQKLHVSINIYKNWSHYSILYSETRL